MGFMRDQREAAELDDRRRGLLNDLEWDSCPVCAAIVWGLDDHMAWHERTGTDTPDDHG